VTWPGWQSDQPLPPGRDAHIARLADRDAKERQRKLSRHDAPDFRKPPKKDQQPLFESTDTIPSRSIPSSTSGSH
jgi:hypothetical protein